MFKFPSPPDKFSPPWEGSGEAFISDGQLLLLPQLDANFEDLGYNPAENA